MPPRIQHGPPAASSTTYGGRAVIVFSRRILPIPGTVTTPTTTINARIGDQPPSATSTTDSGTHVVIQTDGQQKVGLRPGRAATRPGHHMREATSRVSVCGHTSPTQANSQRTPSIIVKPRSRVSVSPRCTVAVSYTSDAADDLLCVDLGGRR